ncbi:hypothetical protein CC86DRAFT_415225, partial [Ophiobolus disseminans]
MSFIDFTQASSSPIRASEKPHSSKQLSASLHNCSLPQNGDSLVVQSGRADEHSGIAIQEKKPCQSDCSASWEQNCGAKDLEWHDEDLIIIDHRGDIVLTVADGAFENVDEKRSRFLVRSKCLQEFPEWKCLLLTEPPFTLTPPVEDDQASGTTLEAPELSSCVTPAQSVVGFDTQCDPDSRARLKTKAEALYLTSFTRCLPHYRLASSIRDLTKHSRSACTTLRGFRLSIPHGTSHRAVAR